MSKYLKLFETTAAYDAAKDNLILPNVSLTVDNNTVHYNPSSPTPPTPTHDYVEIAGIKWATMNIGATGVTDYGLYFQWGDTQGYTADQVGSGEGKKYFGWADYKYGNGTSSPRASDMTKYNSTDGKTVLEASDDAVIANWGGSWRMPTTDEYAALSAATDFIDSGGTTISDTNKLTTLSGVTGILVADKNDHSKRLFFPAAGYCSNGRVNLVGSYGVYWSSSLSTSSVTNGRYLYFYSGGVLWQDSYYYRYYGLSVRPVLDE